MNTKSSQKINSKNFFGICIFIAALLLIFVQADINAQTKSVKHSLKNIDCKTCHTCDVPTKQNPCLVDCPREEMITVHQPAEKGPDIVVIDKLADKYMPVTFSHKVHAQMSKMAGGCQSCHHYNTSGPILGCQDCHSVERKRDDLSKPDLQAAYHRQCINCHKEWSGKTDCNSCHLPKGSTLAQQKVKPGKDHPQVKEPEKIVYETEYDDGKIVTFFHNDHTKLFGADCVSCHQNESCTRCHDKTKEKNIVASGLPERLKGKGGELHNTCYKCHDENNCAKCHLNKEMKPFNHQVSTGWALNRFHEKLKCENCHGTKKEGALSIRFTKLNSECTSCHSNFLDGSFDHKITGLQLDEMHIDFDCSDCHAENNFSKNDCSGCHDDYSYPKEKPGTIIKLTRK